MAQFAGVALMSTILLCGLGESDNMQAQSDAKPSQRRDIQDYLEGPLNPVYQMTELVLEDIVQPNYLTEMEEKIGRGFLEPDDFIDSFEDDWEDWVIYLIGFTILAAVGVLLILFMPLVGAIVACCRCCGNCGGRPRAMDGKYSTCKRVCCGVTFFVVTSAITLGVVCMFAFNSEINRRLYNEDGNIWDELVDSLKKMNKYIDDTVDEMDTKILDRYIDKKDLLIATLEDIPSEAVELINNETHAIENLEELLTFTNNLTSLNESLTSAIQFQDKLDNLLSILSAGIEELRIETFDLLHGCTTQECEVLRSETEELSVAMNTSSIQLENVTVLVHESLAQNLDQAIEESHKEFDKIHQTISETIADEINEVKSYTNQIQHEIEKFINDTAMTLDDIDIDTAEETLRDVKGDISEYEEISYWALVAFGVPLCIIVFCGFTGLLFGIVCPRPSPNTGCFSADRTFGSNALLAGVGFTFIFYWMYALVVLVIFVAGGMTHTEACRHLVNYNVSESTQVLEIFDTMGVNQMNESLGVAISPLSAYTSCEGNHSFYTALDLENNGYNISDIVDTSEIKEAIDEIKNKPIHIPPIHIMNDTVQELLTRLGGEFDGLNFSLYYEELSVPVTTVNITHMIHLLVELVHNDTINDTEIQSLISKYNQTQYNLVEPAEELALNMTEELQLVETYIPETSLGDLASDLATAEDTINSNGTALVGEFVNRTADELYDQTVVFTNEMITTVEDDLGCCEPLYAAVTDTIDSVCVKTLYPLNGFWFSLGWCLFFLIPSIIISFILADEYRKAHPYMEGVETTFDEPGQTAYDAYAGVPDYWTFDNASASSVQMYQLPRAQLKPQTTNHPKSPNQSGGMAAFDNPIYSNDEEIKIPRPTVIPTPYYPPSTIQRKQQEQDRASPSPPPSYRDAVDSDERTSYDDKYDTQM